MKLTPQQIDRLYQFTRQHYVDYYDLQTELVDHLANAIEQQWLENPKISFEEALQIEFKKFGIFGFMDVVEQRQETLNKKYNQLVWTHFKSFFQLPQILGTLAAIMLLYQLLSENQYAHLISVTLMGVLLVLVFGGLFWLRYQNKKRNKQSGKKWLFRDILFSYGSLGSFSYLPAQVFIRGEVTAYSPLGLFLFSAFLVSMFLLQYILLVRIPQKAETYLCETYPEYRLERN